MCSTTISATDTLNAVCFTTTLHFQHENLEPSTKGWPITANVGVVFSVNMTNGLPYLAVISLGHASLDVKIHADNMC